jgi:hypothetical protein
VNMEWSEIGGMIMFLLHSSTVWRNTITYITYTSSVRSSQRTYSKNHYKEQSVTAVSRMNKICGQNAEFLDVKAD